MKKVWLSSLVKSQDTVTKLIGRLKTYGLAADGHFWEDDLPQAAWIKPRNELLDPAIALWAILGARDALSTPSLRYGLSLLAIAVQAQRGIGFPIVLVQTDGDLLTEGDLPTALKGAQVLGANDPGLGAKLVAQAHVRPEEKALEYRLDVYGAPQIGTWFEVGAARGTWHGAMCGVAGADITFHAVGPKGRLPSRTVLNYPLQGMRLTLGEKEYTAWAVQNEMDADTSYFVKAEGSPDSLLFGPYVSDAEALVYVVALK